MQCLTKNRETKWRLFSYKITSDSGSAPNPFGKFCTLAICKPKIRSVANKGDVIIGLDTGDRGRIVYCMEVTQKILWKDYIHSCRNDNDFKCKVPTSANHPGDCIWRLDNDLIHPNPLSSCSGHKPSNFARDISKGKSVLIGEQFWYFGKGDQVEIFLTDELKSILPKKQGHKSNSNDKYKDSFVDFFNPALSDNKITACGIYGCPSNPCYDMSTFLVSLAINETESILTPAKRKRC
jgi:hypothetical protein